MASDGALNPKMQRFVPARHRTGQPVNQWTEGKTEPQMQKQQLRRQTREEFIMSSRTRPDPFQHMDTLISALDNGLRTVFASAQTDRQPVPAETQHAADSTAQQASLSAEEAALSAQLMRINHVGEICAQALYTGQAAGTANAALRQHLQEAADEEVDHLAWTEQRLQELNSHRSYLNPLWYAGSFALGFAAARAGDDWSLGFVEETEKQVEQHLDDHLRRLPAGDTRSRTIVAAMREDEIRHAQHARELGARRLPLPIRLGMRACSKVMTTIAARI